MSQYQDDNEWEDWGPSKSQLKRDAEAWLGVWSDNTALCRSSPAATAASLRAVQNLIDGMARQRRLYIANGMREAITAGANVGGTYSLARWREIQETFDAFETWLQTPMPGCKLPPLVVVSRRGNPYEAPPPVEPTPEPEPEPTPVEPVEEQPA